MFLQRIIVSRELTEAMIRQKIVAIAYETIEIEDGSLLLLTPMSEADLLIGAVLVTGDKAPVLVTAEMVSTMKHKDVQEK